MHIIDNIMVFSSTMYTSVRPSYTMSFRCTLSWQWMRWLGFSANVIPCICFARMVTKQTNKSHKKAASASKMPFMGEAATLRNPCKGMTFVHVHGKTSLKSFRRNIWWCLSIRKSVVCAEFSYELSFYWRPLRKLFWYLKREYPWLWDMLVTMCWQSKAAQRQCFWRLFAWFNHHACSPHW